MEKWKVESGKKKKRENKGRKNEIQVK